MTIPVLMNKYREAVFVNRLKDTYSIFSQAYKLAVAEHGDPDGWDIGTSATKEGAIKVYEYFKPFLKQAEECGGEFGCFANSYQTFTGVEYGYPPREHTLYTRGLLLNGVAFAFSSSGSGCPYDEIRAMEKCAVLYVDLNAYDPPNQAGVDYFGFLITPNGVKPMGYIGDNGGGNGYTCIYGATNNGNGTGCSAYVLAKGNMDYLRHDISNIWK